MITINGLGSNPEPTLNTTITCFRSGKTEKVGLHQDLFQSGIKQAKAIADHVSGVIHSGLEVAADIAEKAKDIVLPDNWSFQFFNGPAETCKGKAKKLIAGLYLDKLTFCDTH